MITYFAKYDLITGAFRGCGSCAPIHLDLQAAPGIGVVESDADVLVPTEVDGNTVMTVDLAPVRSFLRDRIDREAGEIRSRYITTAPGQAQTYEKKEAEARRWTDGADAAGFPFMAAEANLHAVPIAQVQSEIMAQVNTLTPLAAAIEAHRVAAKRAVSAATIPGAMVAAAIVDWAAITA